ncbi:MAG: cupin domain-containing protein [Patescibacteria group bacterium]|nr:cupin domain-containing protein [Patescibacteria group bacterium]
MNKKILKLIKYSPGGILSKVIEKNEKMDITLFCLAAKTEISEHTSTKPGFVYVVEGDGVFNLAGKAITMSPGVLIYMKENAVHFLKANKNTSFLLALANN